MINKYIKVEQGSYRNQDMSGRIFPILKDYQRFAGKEGGFITVDCSELDGFEGLDKARINVPAITDLTLTTEGAFQIQRDELKTDSTDAPVNTAEETDEQAIDRIAARFEILDEMAEAVSTSKVRAMIVSGPPGIGKSYGVERALEKRSMFEDQLVQFIYDNKHKLREISLRMVLKIADLWKMAPDRYQHLAEQTCMRPGA